MKIAVRDQIASYIRDVPNFPKPGVTFKDITPLMSDPQGYQLAIEALADHAPAGIEVVAGIEARGFMFAAPLALHLGAGFVPIRHPGKLPGKTFEEGYTLEYGQGRLSILRDAVAPGTKVLLVDDVLATGGTLAAGAHLLRKVGADLMQVQVLLEILELEGREHLTAEGITNYAAVLVQ